MNTPLTRRRFFAIAALTWFDARSMTIASNYGVGADAASYFVAAFLAILATLVGLAIAFAPELPGRRITAPVKRMRDTGRC